MNIVKKLISLSLLSTFALLTLHGGIAFSEEKKETQPKQEAAAKTSPSDPLAVVNGAAITRAEVARAVKVLLSQNRITQQVTPDQMKQAEEAALEQLISAEILYQAGLKLEIKDLDKQVEEKITQGKARFPSTEEYEKALKTADLTEKELKELTRKDIIVGNVVEKEIAAKITVPDQDVKKFYDENQDKFKKGESVRASHILCGVDANASPEEKKKAKEKAEALLKKIKAGEDFAKLAKENSTCPSSAQGGDLGSFGKGQMVPPFEKAAFALKQGEVSDVVETQFGYHIIKLTEKKDAETIKLDETKDRIKDYLKNQKVQKAVADYITELKGKMKVEMLNK
ncbi:MAG: peptidyl-prolyl cis-trans isomerase [Geobacteraceae bacterium]|nr:MAG: peptidyl-prolyl cis-trans isomerase [Geobacteraceae bacterium]